jgi:hypothetical protein
MVGVLFLGLLLGMQHALEADHLAAVASLTAHNRSNRNIIRHGAVWGLGHMLTLSVFAGAVVLSERAVSHDGGQVHLHAHSHAGDHAPHRLSEHDHVHPDGFPMRSLLVGMMHGLAGSAALVVVAATALRSPLEGLTYVILFGLGSVAGMALLSAAVAVPLSLSARLLTWANRGLQGVIAVRAP